MLLTITSTSPPATDLGFLLHKNPAASRSVELGFGVAHACYPEAEPGRCTIAMMLEVDPVALVRRSRGGPFPLAPYVNDRPYVASSFMSVALRKMFGTALQGKCKERPELVDQPLELSAWLPVLPARGGERLLRSLFEPLGYEVRARAIPLDEQVPDWGDSPYFDVRISAYCRVRDLLGQLYVLLPVLDDAKHYWVTSDEIDKLVDGAAGWLAGHPERDLIVHRYLRHQRGLAAEAVGRLLEDDATAAQPDPEAANPPTEHARLRDLRMAAVLSALTASGARRVLDLGCGDGRLLAGLLTSAQFEEVVGVDASAAALERAARRLHLDEMAPRQRHRVRLLQGALTYSDRRLAGYDAAVLMEVIEHLDPDRLGALEQAVFGAAAPATVVVTTPNAEYNAHYPDLPAGAMRHPDHRFEWTRAEFRAWAELVARRHGYAATFESAGPDHPQAGPPTQLAVLARRR